MPVFSLDPEQTDWCAELRTLAVERLRPLAEKGEPGRVNRPLIAALGELGLLARLFTGAEGRRAGRGGASVSERGGGGGAERGRGAGALELCLLRESLAQGCTEAETALALQGLGACPVAQAGTERQRARWLPEVSAGRAVAAFALSEPGAGSDAAALALRAEPDGDGWLLTGEKRWISNAPEADFYTVFARTDGSEGARGRGITAFLVPADRPGLTGSAIEMLAPHAIGALVFDAVPVTREDVLGEEGHGFRVAMDTLNLFRPSVGAFAVGMARAALDATLEHTARRTAFGGPLKDLQAVAHQVAEMATRTEAARLLVYAAAEAYDTGAPDVPRGSAMAKLFATETAQFVVDTAVQLHGAGALQRGHPLEHLYREVRAPRIYEGASEVQRTIIAKELYKEQRADPECTRSERTEPAPVGERAV
ncbi:MULTISPECIES: acyl-CoA dehydrogenase family protein [unclassified Streptomyces]|uniref:acyl-CoA dehydrogenase family protein n=1 Tax=unclassified Streptomyces TaxID=2593676 RepID=UPI00081D7F39|nr:MULTISPECIES: acyl-CoA dehydrogenase family protein [unclassified Streptomyces]MYZ38106.1 acyl-CoA dehydrogenase [Streptomyces sp. SID4917]SCF96321.1 Acyl-CoA dehydrogenase [Streptomyces sp. MnatMP-M17]